MESNYQLYDAISDIIILLDGNNNITFLNPSAKDYFCTQKSLIKQNYFAACQSSALQPIVDLNTHTATTPSHTTQPIEWKIIDSDHIKILIGKPKQPLFKPDIYLASLLNSLYQGLHIYWTDTNNRVISCNLSQAQSVGLKPEQLFGKTLDEVGVLLNIPPSMVEKICENNQQVIDNNQPYLFEEEFKFSEDSQNFLSYKAPFFDEQGKTLGIIGISTDITPLKKLQKAIEKSKYSTDVYLESILMSSPSNIYWLDREGRAIGCNKNLLAGFDLKEPSDIIGKSISDVALASGWDPALAQEIQEHIQQVMETGQPDITREKVIRNGQERVFLSSKSPMIDKSGEIIGLLGISTDITAQVQIEKDLEEAKEKAEVSNRAKSQFIANISHDIRTPLVGIQGLANWLEEKIPAEFQTDIHAILNSSTELLSLLNNVIHLTKLEFYDEAQDKNQPFDLKMMINQLVDLFIPVSKPKNIILKCDYPDNLPHTFISNSSLIQRAILNLISNALKFTESGHVIISVEKNKASTNKNKKNFPLLIIIEDTGIGIAEEEQTKIFSSFYRVNPSYQGKYQGSGLGLSIAKRFIEQLGGKIWLSSEFGKGSRFFIELSMQPANQSASTIEYIDEYSKNQASLIHPNKPTPSPYQQTLANNKTLTRVLLVEDNSLIQKGGANTLNKLNCYVDIAANGTQALEMAKIYQFDLILLDIGLPDYDGFWVATQIRQLPEHSDTPIIALTGHMDEQYRQQCIDVGMNDFISKPLTLINCKAALIRFVSHYKEQ